MIIRANAKNVAAVYMSTCYDLLLGVFVQNHSPLSAEVCKLGLLLATEASIMMSNGVEFSFLLLFLLCEWCKAPDRYACSCFGVV